MLLQHRQGPFAWTPRFAVPSLWLDDSAEETHAKPCCAMLCHVLPGWSRGPALPGLCQAVAAQVTGLSHAATGCELPAKRAMGTTPHHPTLIGFLLSQGWHWVLWCTPCPPAPLSPSILTGPTGAMGTAVVHAQLGFGTHITLHTGSPAPKGCPPIVLSLQRPPADGAMLGTQGPWGCPDGCGEHWGCSPSRCLPCPPTHSNHARGHFR